MSRDPVRILVTNMLSMDVDAAASTRRLASTNSFANWIARTAMNQALDKLVKPTPRASAVPEARAVWDEEFAGASEAVARAHAAVAATRRAAAPAIDRDPAAVAAEDAETWRQLLDTPVVPAADTDVRELCLNSDSSDALDLSEFPAALTVDPYARVAPEMARINGNIKALLGVDHPVLATVAKYFFNFEGGKKIRPAMLLLMSQAVNEHVARDAAGASGAPPAARLPPVAVLALQQRLAEITELIHTASLLHDDVIDGADTRRGAASLNAAFGNKLAILGGDFLLARASVCLARLRNMRVVELLSTVIEHLVKGEVMQMRAALRNDDAQRAAVELYLRKTYYKTGSLMANSCRAVAMLGGYSDALCSAAFAYGCHVGVAFQLVDDLLDFQGTSAALGKPVHADLKAGIATAPVLFAAQRFPTLLPLIQRKFASPGDVDAVLQFVAAADGITATRRLAIAHGQQALRALATLSDSPARTALAALVHRVLSRDR